MQKQEMRWLDEEKQLKKVFPLEVSHRSESMSFTITADLGDTQGIIIAIRVQDLSTKKWYNWDRSIGWHDPATPPVCTPGMNLYIAMWACNIGRYGLLTLTISDDTGTVIAQQSVFGVPYYDGDINNGVGIETGTIEMPPREYAITLTVVE